MTTVVSNELRPLKGETTLNPSLRHPNAPNTVWVANQTIQIRDQALFLGPLVAVELLQRFYNSATRRSWNTCFSQSQKWLDILRDSPTNKVSCALYQMGISALTRGLQEWLRADVTTLNLTRMRASVSCLQTRTTVRLCSLPSHIPTPYH